MPCCLLQAGGRLEAIFEGALSLGFLSPPRSPHSLSQAGVCLISGDLLDLLSSGVHASATLKHLRVLCSSDSLNLLAGQIYERDSFFLPGNDLPEFADDYCRGAQPCGSWNCH